MYRLLKSRPVEFSELVRKSLGVTTYVPGIHIVSTDCRVMSSTSIPHEERTATEKRESDLIILASQ